MSFSKDFKCKSPKEKEIVCLCNNVSRARIEEAITKGCNTLNKIFDCTMAGVGPCGGSCRRKVQPMIDSFQTCGKFPETLKDPRNRGRCK